MDRTERVLLAKIAFETRERGLDVKQIHVYEDKRKAAHGDRFGGK